jgi:hypothetical protein
MPVTTEPLFGLDTARDGLPEVPAGLSAGRRRTLRRLLLLELGKHPITGLPVHPDAPTDTTAKDRFPRPMTCGTCTHRFVQNLGTERSYPKCDRLSKDRLEARTATTDTPRWMPACIGYTPTEGYVWK